MFPGLLEMLTGRRLHGQLANRLRRKDQAHSTKTPADMHKVPGDDQESTSALTALGPVMAYSPDFWPSLATWKAVGLTATGITSLDNRLIYTHESVKQCHLTDRPTWTLPTGPNCTGPNQPMEIYVYECVWRVCYACVDAKVGGGGLFCYFINTLPMGPR